MAEDSITIDKKDPKPTEQKQYILPIADIRTAKLILTE